MPGRHKLLRLPISWKLVLRQAFEPAREQGPWMSRYAIDYAPEGAVPVRRPT